MMLLFSLIALYRVLIFIGICHNTPIDKYSSEMNKIDSSNAREMIRLYQLCSDYLQVSFSINKERKYVAKLYLIFNLNLYNVIFYIFYIILAQTHYKELAQMHDTRFFTGKYFQELLIFRISRKFSCWFLQFSLKSQQFFIIYLLRS